MASLACMMPFFFLEALDVEHISILSEIYTIPTQVCSITLLVEVNKIQVTCSEDLRDTKCVISVDGLKTPLRLKIRWVLRRYNLSGSESESICPQWRSPGYLCLVQWPSKEGLHTGCCLYEWKVISKCHENLSGIADPVLIGWLENSCSFLSENIHTAKPGPSHCVLT